MSYDINYDTDNIIYIDGNDDPFGINDVMLKMLEIMDERYDLFSGEEAGEPVLIDYTDLLDEDFHALIREAVLSMEPENECLEYDWDAADGNRLLS